jgi:hypothetical protein
LKKLNPLKLSEPGGKAYPGPAARVIQAPD